MVTILTANLAVLIALSGVSASSPSSPPSPPPASLRRPTTWDSDQMERSGAVCVKNATSVVNTRLVFYSLPSGTPPPGGWPVYALFQPWDTSAAPWGSAAPTCGPLYPPFVVESCLKLMEQRCPIAGSSYEDKRACYNCTSHLRRTDKAAYETANCSSEQSNLLWCQQHGKQRSRHSENRPPFENPVEILKPCFSANGSWDPYQEPSQTGLRCSFGAVNGRVWAQRLNQYLLANGIAILQINPGEGDEWVGSAYTDTQWHGGDDRPFLKTLFAQINSGEFGGLGPGTLNLHRLSVSGYSVGAQMVSWMIQVQATGELTTQLNATLRAGAMFAGGTYACYRGNYTGPTGKHKPVGNRSKHPEKPVIPMPDPIGQCKGCNASNQCWRVGCSSTVRKLTGQAPCCAYCCPENFTEQFYEDHPEQYPEHPPTFLVQHRDVDENADACAALNYHHTMLKNGGRSEIAMIEEDQAQCYCIGSSRDSAASGAPTLEYCKRFLPGMAPPDGIHETFYGTFPNGTNFSAAYETYDTERCVRHAMGHADAVEPLTRFLVKYL